MRALILLLSLMTTFGLHAQFHPDSLFHVEIQGNDTDPLINFDGQKKHQVFYNPTSTTRATLLLHLVGTLDSPNSTILYPTEAANNGFHCINLTYRNGTSADFACKDVPDSSCYLNFRKEIIEGVDYSAETNVNASNAIYNRLIKLLQYLDANYPTQNWSQYYSGNNVLWDKVIVSGHSQGGGHAAVMAMSLPIQRVLMFASPNDFSDTLNMLATWTSLPHLLADSSYYSFNALYDDAVDYAIQYGHSQALGQAVFGDTLLVDNASFPYNNTRQLYTKQEVVPGNPLQLTHDIMIRDVETPIDGFGKAEFTCVWLYMLGIDCNEALSVSELSPIKAPKHLTKIVNTMGQETVFTPNTVLLYIYSDGTVEKVFRME